MHPGDSGAAARRRLLGVSAPGAPGEPDFGLLGSSPPWQVLAFPDQGTAGGGPKSFAARIHLIIWVADVEPDGRCLARGRRVSRAARSRERKVRTPQSSVPDNVREGGFK